MAEIAGFERPTIPLYLGIDPGYRNPCAVLWIQPIERHERLLIVSEYYQRLRTTMENAKAVLAHHHACGYDPPWARSFQTMTMAIHRASPMMIRPTMYSG